MQMWNEKGRYIVVPDHKVDEMLDKGWTKEPPGRETPDLRIQRIAHGVREMDRKARDDDQYREDYYTSTGLPDLDKLREETEQLYPGESIGTVTAKDRSLALGWIDHQ